MDDPTKPDLRISYLEHRRKAGITPRSVSVPRPAGEIARPDGNHTSTERNTASRRNNLSLATWDRREQQRGLPAGLNRGTFWSGRSVPGLPSKHVRILTGMEEQVCPMPS
jgi:hypothetical protein